MRWLTEQFRRLMMLVRRRRFDRDLADEMRLHLELRCEEQGARGLSPGDASSAARRNFGNTALLYEHSRDAWGVDWFDRLVQDLRYGARTLRRTPGFTTVAVLALALGIGANTAIFSVVNAVLLRPLGYRDPARLLTLLHHGRDPVSPADYVDWREQSGSFEAMGAAEYWGPNLTGTDQPEHLWGLRVTQSLLPLLGVEPLMGRLFLPGEDLKGAEHEVILGYSLWQRRFAGGRNVLGRTMTLNGEAYTIVGVMPRDFHFAPFWATRAELWAPNVLGDRLANRGGNSLRVFARLKPGVTLEAARSEVAAITARLEQRFPGTNRDVRVTPLIENVVGRIETPMLVLLGAVGFVLLIACANVAHMLLARAAARQKEIALRAALGAGRARMIRQFLTESLLLAALGAAAGLALAFAGTRALIALSPATIPRLDGVSIDARAVLFLLALAVLAAVAFGLAPALQASAVDLTGALKEGTRGSGGGRHNRARSVLVASEFALAVMLLAGAGLMIRSFAALRAIDPGFNPRKVLSMVVSVAGSREADPGRRDLFYRQLLERVRALPGVAAAGGINHLPLVGDLWGWSFRIEGRPAPRPGEAPVAIYRIVTPGYFAAMRLPILRGRDIAETDDASAPGAVVINQRAAAFYFPGEDALGKRISFAADDDHRPIWLRVVGIAKNAPQDEWTAKPEPEAYLAAFQNREYLQSPGAHFAYLTLVVRTTGDPAALAGAVKQTVWSFDRNLPISEVFTMEGAVALVTAQPRFEMLLLAVFAAVALLLAAIGIYGVMSYSVSRRTHEIGIRVSLGADRATVMRLVLGQGLKLAAAGSAAGLSGALLLSRTMRGLLYGVQPTDPATFVTVALVLAAVALLASYLPARRATRVDPIAALRCE
jgi:predicted permease